MHVLVADIGGTHARFALASIEAGAITLAHEAVLKGAEHPTLQSAWRAYAAKLSLPAPRAAAIAVACPADGETLSFTNSPWSIEVASLKADLGLDRALLINDFAAIGNAVAALDDAHFEHITGPNRPLPEEGVISIIGPGTGLGVSQLVRVENRSQVISTEGGHVSFAPIDALEDEMLARLRARHGRVSAERVVSGPGLAEIYAVLAAHAQARAWDGDDSTLWRTALGGDDPIATAALERFCLCFGAVAGDIALAQGAQALVIAGGLGARIADKLAQSGFSQRFIAKGRFEPLMASLPVKRISHPQPGLFGAAAAFRAGAGRML